jgi:hypothetical protein
MNFQDLIQLQVLKLKAASSMPASVVDSLVESDQVVTRQMCAKVSAELYTALENVCSALDMSKRQFIEAAVADAVQVAEDALEKSGALTQGNL